MARKAYRKRSRSLFIMLLAVSAVFLMRASIASAAPSDAEAAATWIETATRSASPGPIEAEAEALIQRLDEAPAFIEAVRSHPHPQARCLAAELLWRIAEKDKLTDELADQAAYLIGSSPDEPFAAALAEWAIAIKVGIANNGPVEIYPGEEPPSWFTCWSERRDPDFHIACDYARCAVLWNVHRSSNRCLSSAKKYLHRAERVMAEIREQGSESWRADVERSFAEAGTIVQRLGAAVLEKPDDLCLHRNLWLKTRLTLRPVVLSNPAIDFDQIVFTQRHAAHSLRNITGSQYPWNHKPGGDILLKDGFDPSSRVRPVIDGRLGDGHVHGMDLSYDADRVVFGWADQPNWPPSWDTGPHCSPHVFQLRKEQTPTHLYEIGLDGAGLRQVTDHPLWSDFEPTYGPGEEIIFASDRSGRSSECGSFTSDHTVINLYRVERDGSGLRRLSDNKDIDRYPHTLDNGLIGYTRWEYQERHFTEVHAIWSIRPDGTMADAVYKQHLRAPWGLRDTRSVPGSNRLVSIATGHHTLAYGPVVLVDPSYGPNDPRGLDVVTPHTAVQEGPSGGKRVVQGGVPDPGGLYQTPYALSDTCFLVSYSHNRPAYKSQPKYNDTQFAIYVIDVYGNKELVHRDPVYSCSFPLPVRKRAKPRSTPDGTDPKANHATCIVADVYAGLDEVERGTVRWIRVSQRYGWPLDDRIGAMRYIPSNAFQKQYGFWSWSPVRVLGIVPVEEDGSAHFIVPTDAAVYFQALDERFMEVRRMRSHISFQPGETRGCVGCHETRPVAPDVQLEAPLALMREASRPEPPPWGADRLLGYEWLVQPVLDRHCIRCHAGTDAGGGLDFRGRIAENGFARSFNTLFADRPSGRTTATASPLVAISNRFSGAQITPPYAFGSHRSRLIRVLLDDALHRDEVRLAPEDWLTLVSWVDANAPYHDMFFNRRPEQGGSARRDVLFRPDDPLAALHGPRTSETLLNQHDREQKTANGLHR